MAYIDLDYYKTDYLGIDPGDETELTRYINRASDIVDLLTDSKAQNYDDLYSFQQTAIQKATAAIAEYFVENGDTFNDMGVGSEAAGGWSFSTKTTFSSGGKNGTIPTMAIAFLEQADLMRADVIVQGEVRSEAY